MNFDGIELCCPACHGELAEDGTRERVLRCTDCDRRYPVLAGIPDLRLADDPYIERDADRAKGLLLAERLADLDLTGLIAHYYATTSVVPDDDALRYTRGLLAAADRARDVLQCWDAGFGEPLQGHRMLDLGCGTAPLLVATADRFQFACGVDIAFRWLIVARKRLIEAGAAVPLFCACAEALPFPPDQFNLIAGESVLETVADQDLALREVFRTLADGGRAAFSMPNRFSLGPDPHVGIWAGGYLPPPFLAWYVRRHGGIPPKRRLLSARSVRRRMRRAGLADVRVVLPRIPDAQRDQLPPRQARLVDAYNLATQLPLSRSVLLTIGPLLHALAIKRAPQSGS